MGASVRPDGDPLDQLKALKQSDPLEQLKAQKASTLRYDKTPANAGVVPSALDAMTFGLAPKATAAIEAVGDELSGRVKPGDTFGTAYRTNLSAKRAAADQYHEAHPAIDDISQLAGGVAGVVATGGTNTAEDAATLGRLARFGKTIATGARYGAANAAGHSDALEQGRGVSGLADDIGRGAAIGGVTGAVSIPATAVAGKVLNWTPLPRLASKAAGALATRLPSGSAAQQAAESFSGATGEQGAANAVIARRAGMDRAAGYEVPVKQLPPIRPTFYREPPAPPGGWVPPSVTEPGIEDMAIRAKPTGGLAKFKPSPMALDQAGPNVEGLAEGIANRPGPGRAVITKALTARQEAMRPALTGALEEGTGVSADAGMQPLQDAVDARTTEARQLFGAARAETKGQAVNSDTFDKIVKTPAGKKALEVAQTRQGNMFQEGAAPPPPGYSPEQWEGVKSALTKRGIAPPEGPGATALPDPETLHFMKEHLAVLAKLGAQDGEAGALSQSAKGALSVWGKVKDELPDVWKRADDAYAARSRVIDMMNKGRQVYSTPTNPAGPAPKAIAKSLDGLDARVSASPLEEQQALQTGAGMAAQAKLATAPASVKAPGRIFARSPEVQRQTAYAFPSPAHADEFQGVVSSWDKAQQQAERMTGNSRTALRGNEAGDTDLLPLNRIVSGRPRGMLRSIVSKLDAEYQAGAKQKLDGEIAKILTSPDGNALVKAAQAGDARARMLLSMRLAASAGASDYATTRDSHSRQGARTP